MVKCQISNAARPFRAPRLIAVAMLMVLANLGPTGMDAAARPVATIRFAFWGDPAERDAYVRVIDGFEALHPEFDVVPDYTPGQSDYYRKLATDFAGGEPPALFLINYRQFGQYAAAGALEPVAPFLAASQSIRPEDYADVAMEAFRFGGGTQSCMPQNVSSLVIYLNADLFAQAGIPLPSEGWSWEQFVAAAQALTQDRDGDGSIDQYGVVVDPSIVRMAPFIWGAGGEIVDDTDRPTRLTLDSPGALAGLRAFVSLGEAGYGVVPGAAESLAEDGVDRFMRGGAAMLFDSRRVVPSLRTIDGFAWDVAPLPVIERAATVLHSDAFCMATRGGDAESTWTFVEFAAGEAGQSILAETGRIVPSLDRVADSELFTRGRPAGDPGEALPPANSQVYLDNVQVMRRLPSISTWPEIEDVINVEFERALFEAFDLDTAVANAIANSRSAFERAAGG